MQQNGYIYRRGGWWILRFRETVNEKGELRTVQRAEKLVPVSSHYKTKTSVRGLVAERLTEVNRANSNPETVVTLGDFVDTVYLPHIETHMRPSTQKGYRGMWEDHLKARCADVLLRSVRTSDVQRWLERIAAQDKTKAGHRLTHESMKHVKSVLSGIFSAAKRLGYFDSFNPVAGSAIPPAPRGRETYAYSTQELLRMLKVLPEPAATIVAVAGLTGARRSEIQGLTWAAFRDNALYIEQSIWEGKASEPKTRASRAPIPVIPSLASLLREHRKRLGNPIAGPMFPSGSGKPASLNNVLGRQILPVLNRCAICQKTKFGHILTDHAYQRDQSVPEWRGWHAFRRGLATNLHDLGIDDKTTQGILRHSNVSVTQASYIKTLPQQSLDAMQALEISTTLCADSCAKETPNPSSAVN